MKAIGNTILAILIIGILLAVLFLRQGNRNPLCEPALYLGEPGNHPQDVIASVIDELGGLPQTDVRLATIDDPRIIVPVEDWQIRSAVVTNSDDKFARVLRSENPVMNFAIDLDVTWEDGASGIVQWQSWRYGLVSCPVVISKGNGPLGTVKIIALTPAPPPPEGTPEPAPEG
jgi:hypothetical protein